MAMRACSLAGFVLILVGSVVYSNCDKTRQDSREASDLDIRCAEVAKQKRHQLAQSSDDELLYKRTAFHSQMLGTCVEASEREVGNDFQIVDVSRDFFRADPLNPTPFGLLFGCSRDGVNNLRIEIAEKYRGNLSRAPSGEIMDDYEGGPPAIIKTPSNPVTRERCIALYTRKLEEVR